MDNMARAKYDLIIENEPLPDDSFLTLFKFPAMQSQFDKPPEDLHLTVRPTTLKMKLHSIFGKMSTIDRSNAQTLASKSVPDTYPNGFADRNFYTSSKVTIDDGQLFVAKIVNNQVVCRPVSHMMTMRADFSHLDLKEESDIKEEVRPVSVKFAGPDRKSVASKAAEVDEVDEIDDQEAQYVIRSIISKDAGIARKNLFGVGAEITLKQEVDVTIDVKPAILIPDIKPKIERMDVDDVYEYGPPNDGECDRTTSPGLVKKLVHECLTRAKLVSFSEAHEYLRNHKINPEKKTLNNKDLLDALTEHGVLVQGNWALKSESIIRDLNQQQSQPQKFTETTGISINLYVMARDYLLWLFTQNRLVARVQFSQIVKIPDHDVLELFNQVSMFRKDLKKWELKLPTDTKFIKQFPEVVQRQATLWKVRKANKLSHYKP